MYTQQSRSDFSQQIAYEQTALQLVYDFARPQTNERPRSTEGGSSTLYINSDVEIEQSVDPGLYRSQQKDDIPLGGRHGSEEIRSGQSALDSMIEQLLPLSFIMSYKHIDLLIVWVLEEHHQSGVLDSLNEKEGFKSKITKMHSLVDDNDFSIPSPLDEYPEVFQRLFALYYRLVEARHAVIHRDDFTVDNGVFKAQSKKDGDYVHELSMEKILELARIVVIVGDSVKEDSVEPSQVQELKARLDLLKDVHKEGQYDVTPIWSTQIHQFVEATSPGAGSWTINIDEVRNASNRTPASKGFLLVVKAIHDCSQIEEWVIPSDQLEGQDEIEISLSEDPWEEYKGWTLETGQSSV